MQLHKCAAFSGLLLSLAATLPAQTPASFLEGRNGGNGSASAMAIADFNNDGIPDVATIDANNGVTIFLGNGDGTFRELPPIGVVGVSIAAADFNQDGNLDLVAGGSVLLGNGDGTFQSPSVYLFEATLVSIGDFNGDGFPDIAAISPFTPEVEVFFGDGNGGFSLGPSTPLTSLTVGAMIAADFDNDGLDDLAIGVSTGGYGGTGYVEVLLGTTGGNFSVSQYTVGKNNSFPSALAAADFNGDGILDLAVGDKNITHFSVLLGTGSGFSAPIRTGAPPQISSLAVADLNGDGIPDLVAGSYLAEAAVYYGNGDGAFSYQREVVTGYHSSQIALADLTGKGSLYLLSANTTGVLVSYAEQAPALTVMPSTAPGRFRTAEAYPAGTSPSSAALADFNGDGHLDAAAVGANASVAVLLGDGNGRLGPEQQFPLYVAAKAIAAADVNGDGKLDLVMVGNQHVQTLLGNGDGTFGTPIVGSCAACDFPVILADVNHDGKLDVVTAGGLGVAVLLGNGDGTFQTPSFYGNLSPSSIAAGDLNGDGNLDVVVTTSYTKNHPGAAFILFGNSNGSFGSPVQLNNGASTSAIVADFNNDGKLDIVTTFGRQVAVYLGNGDGTFQAPLVQGMIVFPPLLAADLNADGNLDLISPSGQVNGNATILLGHGDGTFTTQLTEYLISSFPLAAGDFNGDGKPDLLCPTGGGNSVWLLLNTTP